MKILVGLFIGAIGLYVGGMTAMVAGSDTLLKFVPQEVVYQDDIQYSDGAAMFPNTLLQNANYELQP